MLARHDLITTNTHSARNKLLRAYTGPFQIMKREGNHYTINIDGTQATYHRRHLKEITYKEEEEKKEETGGKEE